MSSFSVVLPIAKPRTVRDLHLGESGTVCCLNDPEMALKLLEMGCVPGAEVRLRSRAPLGGPVTVVVAGEYTLSLRREEAATIQLKAS